MGQDDAVDVQLRFEAERSDMVKVGADLNRVVSQIAKNLGNDLDKPFAEIRKSLSESMTTIANSLDNPITSTGKKFAVMRREVYTMSNLISQMDEHINNLPMGSLKESAKVVQRNFQSIVDNVKELSQGNYIGKAANETRNMAPEPEDNDTIREYIDNLKRENEELRRNTQVNNESTQQRLRNRKAIEDTRTELEKYLDSMQPEKWNADVMQFRSDLVSKMVTEVENLLAEETKIEHTEENLNNIIATNNDLIKMRNGYKYAELELSRRINEEVANRKANGILTDSAEMAQLKETRDVFASQVKALNSRIQQNKILQNEIKETLKIEKETTKEDEKQNDVEKEKSEELQSQIRLHQEDIKQARAATSQYYYRLRSMKMLNRYLQMANNAMNNFGKKALSSFAKLGKSITGVTKKFKLFHLNVNKANKSLKNHTKIVKSTTRAHDDWGKSLKRSLTTVLKYTLGIRSLYVLFNKLRGAASEGMEVMATQYNSVNQTMSSIVTSLNQMKNALATIVQPIMVLIAPVLAKLAEMLSNVTAKIASFIAAFTGQKTIFKAIRINKDYIDSIKKQKKALQELNKEQLAHYDMLNVIDQKKEDTSDEDESDVIGFEEIPIEADSAIVDFVNKLKELLKKIKDFIKQLLEPLIAAWEKWKEAIKEALRKLWEAIKKFVKDFLRDFLQAWKEYAQQIAENILAILKNIIDFIRIIITKIDEAWNHAQNGLRILRAIFKIIERITWYIRKMTDYLVKWAEKLNLKPLFTAIADTLEQEIVPAVEKIMRAIYEIVWMGFLEIVRWLLEDAGPKIIDIWGDIWTVISTIIDKIRQALTNGDDEFDEADRLYRILQSIEEILDFILLGIKYCTDATKEWAEELDFNPLFEAMEVALEGIKLGVVGIVELFAYLYTKILLPMLTYIIEEALPKIELIIGIVAATIGIIAHRITEALEKGDLGREILDIILGYVDDVLNCIMEIALWTAEWAYRLDFEPFFKSIRDLLVDIAPLVDFLLKTLTELWVNVVLPFVQYLIEDGLPKLNQILSEVVQKVDWDHLNAKVHEFLVAFEEFLEKAWETFVIILGDLGDAFAKFVNSESFDHIVDTLIYWMENADPDKMAKGIEQLVIRFIELKAALSFGTILGSFKEMVMTLINFGNNRALAKNIAKNTEAINALKGGDTPDPKKGGISGLLGMLNKLGPESGKALTKLQKFGGVSSIAGGGILSLTGLLDGLTNGFSLSEIAATGVGDALIGLGLVMLGVVSGPMGAAVALAIFAVEQMIIGIHERMTKFGESLPEAIGSILNTIAEKVAWVFSHLGEILGNLIGKLISYIINSFKDWIASYDGDLVQLGIDLVKGIFKVLLFPVKLVWEIVKAFFTGFVKGFRDGFDMHSPSKHPDIVSLGVDILGGIFNGMVSAILGFPMWLWNNIIVPIKDAFVEKAKDIWGDLKEAGSGFIENLKEGAESKYNDIKESISGLWGDIKEGVSTWWSGITQDISDWWEGIKSSASEKYEDIRSTIETKWSEAKENVSTWWGEISSDLGTWWEGIKSDASTKFEDVRSEIENKWNDIKENTSTLWGEVTDSLKDCWDNIKSDASDKFEDIRSGIEDKWLELKDNIHSIWQDISSDLRGWWDNLLGDARGKFEDIKDGIADKWEKVKSNTSDVWDNVKDTVGNKVEAIKEHKDKMEDAGHNLIDGLKEGLENRMHSALDTVRNIAGQIADAARDAFDIHSPSRVFAEIGEMVTAGLVEGIDEDSDDAKDAIYNLVPGLEVFDRLYDIIISKLSTLRQDAVLIVDSMIDEISASMSKLDSLDVLGSTISKLNNIDIPDIAAGKVVSPQIEMLINKDNSKLEKLLEDILDKLDELPDNSGDNNSNNPNVVLQLDRTVLAEAVWDETEKRYKQTGRRPVFA